MKSQIDSLDIRCGSVFKILNHLRAITQGQYRFKTFKIKHFDYSWSSDNMCWI
jgi:hypothetical protein